MLVSQFCMESNMSQIPKKAWIQYHSDMNYESGTEGLAIYIPSIKGYINYNFVHTLNTSKNADIWRLSIVNLYDNDAKLIKQITKTGAEWEMAIRISNRSDFIGGYAHGDEKFTSMKLYLDEIETNITTLNRCKQFCEAKIVIDSDGFDPADGCTKVLEHHKEYIITEDGITLEQTIRWCGDYTLDGKLGSYLAMMPPLKHSVTANTDVITDSFYTNLDKMPVTIGKVLSQEKENVESVCVFGRQSGIFFTMSKANTFPKCNYGNIMLLSDNGGLNYNKMYFVFARDCSVAMGDVWRATTNYNIEWK